MVGFHRCSRIWDPQVYTQPHLLSLFLYQSDNLAFYSDNMKLGSVWNTVNFKSVRKKFDKYIQMNGWNWCHSYNYLIEYLIKDDALTNYAWKEVAQKMYDDVLSSQYGIDNKNCFSIGPESIQLKPELKEKIIPTQEDLQYMEDLVDMHTESHRL